MWTSYLSGHPGLDRWELGPHRFLYLWLVRWKVAAELYALGYGVLSLDSDTSIRADIYAYIKAPPFSSYQVVAHTDIDDRQPQLNCGFTYLPPPRTRKSRRGLVGKGGKKGDGPPEAKEQLVPPSRATSGALWLVTEASKRVEMFLSLTQVPLTPQGHPSPNAVWEQLTWNDAALSAFAGRMIFREAVGDFLTPEDRDKWRRRVELEGGWIPAQGRAGGPCADSDSSDFPSFLFYLPLLLSPPLCHHLPCKSREWNGVVPLAEMAWLPPREGHAAFATPLPPPFLRSPALASDSALLWGRLHGDARGFALRLAARGVEAVLAPWTRAIPWPKHRGIDSEGVKAHPLRVPLGVFMACANFHCILIFRPFRMPPRRLDSIRMSPSDA